MTLTVDQEQLRKGGNVLQPIEVATGHCPVSHEPGGYHNDAIGNYKGSPRSDGDYKSEELALRPL